MKLQTSGVVARKLKSWCTGALLRTGQPMSDNAFEKICVRQDVTAKHPAVTVHTDSAYKEHMIEAQKNSILSMLKHIWSTSGLGFSQVHTKEASALEAAS